MTPTKHPEQDQLVILVKMILQTLSLTKCFQFVHLAPMAAGVQTLDTL